MEVFPGLFRRPQFFVRKNVNSEMLKIVLITLELRITVTSTKILQKFNLSSRGSNSNEEICDVKNFFSKVADGCFLIIITCCNTIC